MPGEPGKQDTNERISDVNSEQLVYERTQTDRLNRRLLCSLLDNLNRNDFTKFWDNANSSDINSCNNGDDIFPENILDEPDELEHIEETGGYDESNLNEGSDDDENKQNSDDKKDEKKKRKTSQKPKLNILRLMDKNGLTALESYFKYVNFKGKGHEREDLNIIMRKLEIWAHQLFPSMQFDDCLGKLEKLGANKSVATYVQKIRMGLEDDISRVEDNIDKEYDDDDETQPSLSNDDAFNQLINMQNRQAVPTPANTTSELTVEQRERMLKNRLIAEQRRMARMKARQQQEQLQLQKGVDNQATQNSNERVVNNQSLEITKCIETANFMTLDITSERSLQDVSDAEYMADATDNFPQPSKGNDLCSEIILPVVPITQKNDFLGGKLNSVEESSCSDFMIQLEEKLLDSSKVHSFPSPSNLKPLIGNSIQSSSNLPEGLTSESGHKEMQVGISIEDDIPFLNPAKGAKLFPDEPMVVETNS